MSAEPYIDLVKHPIQIPSPFADYEQYPEPLQYYLHAGRKVIVHLISKVEGQEVGYWACVYLPIDFRLYGDSKTSITSTLSYVAVACRLVFTDNSSLEMPSAVLKELTNRYNPVFDTSSPHVKTAFHPNMASFTLETRIPVTLTLPHVAFDCLVEGRKSRHIATNTSRLLDLLNRDRTFPPIIHGILCNPVKIPVRIPDVPNSSETLLLEPTHLCVNDSTDPLPDEVIDNDQERADE